MTSFHRQRMSLFDVVVSHESRSMTSRAVASLLAIVVFTVSGCRAAEYVGKAVPETVEVSATASGWTSAEEGQRNGNRQHNLFANSLEYGPRWKHDMQKVPVYYMETEHSTLKLRCDADARPTPVITWYKDGRLFSSRQFGTFEKKRHFLRIPDLMSIDRGNYTCVVSNRHGLLQHTFFVDVVVRVLQPPVIVEAPRSQAVDEGVNVTLQCHYYSDVEAFIHWVKYDVEQDPTKNSNSSRISQQPRILKTEGGTQIPGSDTDPTKLVLYNVSQSDSGVYRCYVTNSFGDVNSSATIVVLAGLPSDSFMKSDESHHRTLVFYVIPSVFCSACVLAIILTVTMRLYCQRQRLLRHHKCPVGYCSASIDCQHRFFTLPMDTKWELDPACIELGEQLGEGAFGKVYKATLILNETCSSRLTVAVKKLKDNATEAELHSFINEIEMMKTVGCHINVISFIGCCSQRGPLQVAVEFAKYGCLRDFLRQNRPQTAVDVLPYDDESTPTVNDVHLTPDLLVSFAFQTARGMEFLASKKIIHRDLAARNVLVSDGMIVKIADFGLTKTLNSGITYYRHKSSCRVPIKWMPPESLGSNMYTVKSDVWSYGVLLWELFTYGSSPYPSVPVESLSGLLDAGYRMNKPAIAGDEIYELMLRCWSYKPAERPSFTQLTRCLHSMLSSDDDNSSQYLSPRKAQTFNATSSYDELFHVDFTGSSTDCGNGLSYNLHPVEQLRHTSDDVFAPTGHNPMTQHYDTPPNSRHAVTTESPSWSACVVHDSLTAVANTCSSLYSNCTMPGDVMSNESRRLLLSSSSASTE